ncbi:hypothetical protein HDU97_005120 [Phlyctochytrium planicorne]|nr:hypothetical protein HDU97_005120 [Phlyctochytrium planicorne]
MSSSKSEVIATPVAAAASPVLLSEFGAAQLKLFGLATGLFALLVGTTQLLTFTIGTFEKPPYEYDGAIVAMAVALVVLEITFMVFFGYSLAGTSVVVKSIPNWIITIGGSIGFPVLIASKSAGGLDVRTAFLFMYPLVFSVGSFLWRVFVIGVKSSETRHSKIKGLTVKQAVMVHLRDTLPTIVTVVGGIYSLLFTIRACLSVGSTISGSLIIFVLTVYLPNMYTYMSFKAIPLDKKDYVLDKERGLEAGNFTGIILFSKLYHYIQASRLNPYMFWIGFFLSCAVDKFLPRYVAMRYFKASHSKVDPVDKVDDEITQGDANVAKEDTLAELPPNFKETRLTIDDAEHMSKTLTRNEAHDGREPATFSTNTLDAEADSTRLSVARSSIATPYTMRSSMAGIPKTKTEIQRIAKEKIKIVMDTDAERVRLLVLFHEYFRRDYAYADYASQLLAFAAFLAIPSKLMHPDIMVEKVMVLYGSRMNLGLIITAVGIVFSALGEWVVVEWERKQGLFVSVHIDGVWTINSVLQLP